jgi:hypothetical protein
VDSIVIHQLPGRLAKFKAPDSCRPRDAVRGHRRPRKRVRPPGRVSRIHAGFAAARDAGCAAQARLPGCL